MPQPELRKIRTACLLALLTLIVPAVASAQRMSEERGYDHKGGDYDNFRSSSVRECRQACERDRRCQAYTYNLNTSMCYVKDEVRRLESARDMVTGSRQRWDGDDDNNRDRDISTEEGYDYKGGDYHSFRADTPRECRRECSRERQCRAYTYNYETEMCYLKDRVNTRQRAADMVTGTKDGSGYGGGYGGNNGGGSWRQELTEERGYDYRGGDYRDFSTSGVSRCKSECRDDSRCEAYTFNLRTDTCYLKDRVGDYQRNQDTVTGVKSEAGGGGRPWGEDLTEEEGYDYRGGDYDSFDAPSVSSCKSSCRRDDRCRAYSYNLRTDTCYLKDRVGSYQRNSDTVTGVKED
ncbi:MAG TPA: PAN/Apple domain-containing protein [Thermoanaerobaculia bacterium]|nr:PAN/Apple domain-containing protein [Thermoanaerobaculia bacterium]